MMGGESTVNPLFRSESLGSYNNYYNYYYCEHNNNYNMVDKEKRQLFLRSYQFCRKKSVAERIKGSLVRVKKIVWLRLRSACRLRRLVFFSRFRCAFFCRRRRFSHLLNNRNTHNSSSCFW